MSHEPSTWDLQRQIEQLRTDFRDGFTRVRADSKEDMAEIRRILSSMKYVDPILFEERTQNLKNEIIILRERLTKLEGQNSSLRKLAITTFFAPFLIGIAVILVAGLL